MAGKVTKTNGQIVAEFAHLYGDTYDYSRVNYTGGTKKVTIICRTHGAFDQTPNGHKHGGCVKCGHEKMKAKQSMSIEEFLRRAKEIHGDAYDYTNTKYVNQSTKVSITCKKHGPIQVYTNNHLRGKGCYKCGVAKRVRSVKQKFATMAIEKLKLVHGDTFDYSKVVYDGAMTEVCIVCPTHGEFFQSPNDHKNTKGCRKCSAESMSLRFALPYDSFLTRAVKTHGGKYKYQEGPYVNASLKIPILCPKHGEFLQTPEAHMRGQGCPSCWAPNSKKEQDLCQFITSLGVDVISNTRKIIPPMELDILVPSKNIAIEFNGTFWHSDRNKVKSYHLDKSEACAEQGVRLIHILEHDWETRQEQVKRMLARALGASREEKINARDCTPHDIPYDIAKTFLNNNHIQGATNNVQLTVGLRDAEKVLVAVMTFCKGASLRGKARAQNTNIPWELTRYATSANVRGGASKLLAAAIKRIGPTKIVSFSQNDWYPDGGMYHTLGFKKDSVVPPDYKVFHPYTGMRHKSAWQRKNIPNRLLEIGASTQFSPQTDPRTEWAIQDEVQALRLWDSGKIKWVRN